MDDGSRVQCDNATEPCRQNVYTLWYRLLHYGVSGAPIWWDKNFFKNDTMGEWQLTPYALGVAETFKEFESGLVRRKLKLLERNV